MSSIRPTRPGAALTERERNVLALVAQGLSDREIGRWLGLTPTAVHSHVGRIRSKLGVLNRPHAVARAFDLGILLPARPSPAAPTAPEGR